MRVVVTGGAGFIGANLCRELLRADPASWVVALDDLSTGAAANLTGLEGVELVVGSVLDPGVLTECVTGADAVVHLAARVSVPGSVADPVDTHEVNATGTLRVLEAVRRAGGPHLVVISSSAVYGPDPVLPTHEGLPVDPVSPYAASKAAAEAYARAYADGYRLDVLTVRLFNVFGPLQAPGHAYAAVVPAFVAAALAGQPLPVYGDGGQTRDFTYVGTVAALLAAAVRERVAARHPVNLAFGTRTSLLELVGLLGEVMGRSLPVEHLPPRAGDVRDSQADQTRMRALFPGAAAVPLSEGLRATVAWLASRSG